MKRGPRKGEGGRPARKLYDDPDCWIIVAALWLRTDPKDQRAFETLQMLDFLLTPHDSIELARGTRVRDGVEWDCLSITNTTPPRAVASNSPGRRPLSAPGRQAFRRSRLQLLREKVDFYRHAKLSEREARFCQLCFLGLYFAVGGRVEAVPILKMVGWDLPEAARARLAVIIGRNAAV